LPVNEIFAIDHIECCRRSKCAVGQKCRRSKLSSVKNAVGQNGRWSKIPSVIIAVSQKFRRSKLLSVKNSVGQNGRRSKLRRSKDLETFQEPFYLPHMNYEGNIGFVSGKMKNFHC
jgi:hypothetical protein